MISLVFSWMNSLDLQLSSYFCVLKKNCNNFSVFSVVGFFILKKYPEKSKKINTNEHFH